MLFIRFNGSWHHEGVFIYRNVPIPTEGNPADATAGQQAANAGRAPPVIEREGIRLGQVEQMQPNGLPPVAQAGAGQLPIQGPVIRRLAPNPVWEGVFRLVKIVEVYKIETVRVHAKPFH